MIKDKILELANGLKDELSELSLKIYNNPELGFCEYEASKLHMKILKKYNFEITSPYLGLDTAFKAVYDSKKKGPTISYMAEYDALPEIGHGCGHNILGATSTGSAIVLSKFIDKIGGRVILFGTCAEEMGGAKVNLANSNELDDVDVSLIMHPGSNYSLCGKSLALITRRYEFFGKTSHAASEPENGINALDAQIMLFSALGLLRQQLRSDARVHGIIKEGGVAANVIPDYTDSRFYVRAKDKKYMLETVEKLDNIAKAASLSTGTKVKISEYELANDDIVANEVLNNLLYETLKEYTDEEIVKEPPSLGSTDAGNISHVIPTIHGYFPVSKTKVRGHSKELRDATITEYAKDQMIITIATLAFMGYKIITDEKLLNEVKKEYNDKRDKGIIIPPKK